MYIYISLNTNFCLISRSRASKPASSRRSSPAHWHAQALSLAGAIHCGPSRLLEAPVSGGHPLKRCGANCAVLHTDAASCFGISKQLYSFRTCSLTRTERCRTATSQGAKRDRAAFGFECRVLKTSPLKPQASTGNCRRRHSAVTASLGQAPQSAGICGVGWSNWRVMQARSGIGQHKSTKYACRSSGKANQNDKVSVANHHAPQK